MKIIISAAGLGSRFQKIGINKPKYEIIVNNKSLFNWSLISLKKFFKEEFIFIFRKDAFDKHFILKELKKLGIKKYKFIILKSATRGQAETVSKAKNVVKHTSSILIYNIDTHIDPSLLQKKWFRYDGLILTMKAKGDHWSFAKTKPKSNFALTVAEKKRISSHASVGLYYFKTFKQFLDIFNRYGFELKRNWNEMYICPMYQYLIDSGYKILVKDVPAQKVVCLGTPEEIKKVDPLFISKNVK